MLSTVLLVASLSVALPNFDLDGDGDTDQVDFGVIQTCIGSAEPRCTPADFNGDGYVNQLDLDVFGQIALGPEIPMSSRSSVPLIEIHVQHSGAQTEYEYPVRVVLPQSSIFCRYDQLKFLQNGAELPSWIMESSETSANIWIRLHQLEPGDNVIQVVEGPTGYVPKSVAAQVNTNALGLSTYDPVTLQHCNWEPSSMTLYPQFFNSWPFQYYSFSPGDKIIISGGSNVIHGTYGIQSKVSNDSIQLAQSIAGNAVGDESVAGTIHNTQHPILKTWRTENFSDINIKTVHPSLTVAKSWARKRTDAGEPVLDRVLFDTPWPKLKRRFKPTSTSDMVPVLSPKLSSQGVTVTGKNVSVTTFRNTGSYVKITGSGSGSSATAQDLANHWNASSDPLCTAITATAYGSWVYLSSNNDEPFAILVEGDASPDYGYTSETWEIPCVWAHLAGQTGPDAWVWPSENPTVEQGWRVTGRNEVGWGLGSHREGPYDFEHGWNRNEDPPAYSASQYYYYFDDDTLWVDAGTLPEVNTDTMYCWIGNHDQNTPPYRRLLLITVTSPNGDAGSWESIQIKEVPTNINLNCTSQLWWINPSVVRRPDGSFLLIMTRHQPSLHPSLGEYILYTSSDGVNWETLLPQSSTDATGRLPLPSGLNGPWHGDLVLVGDDLFYMGSCGRGFTSTGDGYRGTVYMWRAKLADPTKWELVLPAVCGYNSLWTDFQDGCYRPCMLYDPSLPGIELGFSNSDPIFDRHSSGGFWYLRDPGWTAAGREVEGPSNVFWAFGRDFSSNDVNWPCPARVTGYAGKGTVAIADGVLKLNAAPSYRKILNWEVFHAPDHEMYMRWKQDPQAAFSFWKKDYYQGPLATMRQSGSPSVFPGHNVGLAFQEGNPSYVPMWRDNVNLGYSSYNCLRFQVWWQSPSDQHLRGWTDPFAANLSDDSSVMSSTGSPDGDKVYDPPSDWSESANLGFASLSAADSSQTKCDLDWVFVKNLLAVEPAVSISTIDGVTPMLAGTDVHLATDTTAELSSSVILEAGGPVLNWGFVYGETAYPTLPKDFVIADQAFSATLSSLRPAGTYYVRSWALCEGGIAYGPETVFMTPGPQHQ